MSLPHVLGYGFAAIVSAIVLAWARASEHSWTIMLGYGTIVLLALGAYRLKYGEWPN
jgi:hypothetical protein